MRLSSKFIRSTLYLLVAVGWGGLILWWYIPVNSFSVKLLVLASLVSLWVGVIGLSWRWKVARFGLIGVPLILAALVAFLPGETVSTYILRDLYVANLRKYDGTRYAWGGENCHGIDCSGLPRQALREALFQYGFSRFNAPAIR